MKEDIEVEWFGHSCIKIRINRTTIFFDPVRKNNLLGTTLTSETGKDISAIFISHDHWDHFDAEAILMLCSHDTRIYCEQSVAAPLSHRMTFDANNLEELRKNSERIIVVKRSEIIELDDVKVKCLGATEGISFLLESRGKKILFMGDSVATTEMVREKPSVVFFPVWAIRNEEGALDDFLSLAKESICIPMHYHTNRSALPNFYADVQEIRRLLPEDVNLRILERNREYKI